MSSLRFNSKLSSGKFSTAYVYGGEKGLINMCRPPDSADKQLDDKTHEEDCFLLIPYNELRQILKTNSFERIKKLIKARLDLEAEEAEYVCKRLLEEYEAGKWDEPLEGEIS